MVRVLLRRLVTGLGTLFLVTVLVFLLIKLTAGDPFDQGPDAAGFSRISPETRAELERIYHFDQPLHRQYLLWLGDAVRGDLGRSIRDRRPVARKIRERLGITLGLNGASLLLTIVLAVPMGAAAAWRPRSRWDRFSGIGTYILYAVPVFWAGLLLQMLFAVHLDWLPLAGLNSEGFRSLGGAARLWDRALHMVLPVACLTYGGLAYVARFVRATLIDSAAGDEVRAARARGMSEWSAVIRHGFRQAAIPLLTLAGFLLPALVAGSVIVETIFSIPGLGRLFVEAAFQRDLPVMLGLALLSGAATLAGIIAADLAYAVADPRVRRE